VAVASRSSTRLDIVSTHAVGTIQTGGWNEQYNYGLWGGWWQIKDFVAKANAPVSIVARDSEKLDVFSVRNDGAVMTAAWEQDVDDGAWRGWWQIADGVTVPGGWITVVSRAANKLDVFMVGNMASRAAPGAAGGVSRTWNPCRDRTWPRSLGTRTSWTSSRFAPTVRFLQQPGSKVSQTALGADGGQLPTVTPRPAYR